jgi:hypothetical protein
MACQVCGSEEAGARCIVCGKQLCTSCVSNCGLKGKDICVQKAGNTVLFRCPATYCAQCGKEALIFKCKDCGITFCKSALDVWAKPCPTCKDYICGYCYESHITTCNSYYDKEEALDKLFKLVQGKKKPKSI